MNTAAYHGTNKKFDNFECPAYFTDKPEIARFFAKRCREASLVYQCSLSLQNPLVVDLGGQSWGGFFLDDEKLQNACVKYAAAGDPEEEEYFAEEGLTVNFLASYAESLGYDGLVAYNCFEENSMTGTQYVVFNPENIVIEKVIEI